MFDGIIAIDKESATVKLSNVINNDILNYNVIFEDSDRHILGRIDSIKNGEATISFLGEFIDNKYYSGVVRCPSVGANIRIINSQELSELVFDNNPGTIILGTNPLYNNYPVKANINMLFGNHTILVGNHGSGKTYTICRIIQNLFNMKDKIPFNANIFIFSSSFEYYEALSSINRINNNLNYKFYNRDSENIITIPLWLMDIDDYADILNISSFEQKEILKRALDIVPIFSSNSDDNLKYKNNLIAKSIRSLIYSNMSPSTIREYIFKILNECNTSDLNLSTKIPGIGYNIELKKCLDLDDNGEFAERSLVIKYLNSLINDKLQVNFDYTSCYFNLENLEMALTFSLIDEYFLFDKDIQHEGLLLKNMIRKLICSQNSKFFNSASYINLEQFINSMLITKNNGRAQIVNYILRDIDNSFSGNIIRVITKILFKFAKKMGTTGLMPINIIIDEGENYFDKCSYDKVVDYDVFKQMFLDGKSYGFTFSLLTTKVEDMPELFISRCCNSLLFKLSCEKSIEFIKNYIPNIPVEIVDSVKSLQTGTCIACGRIVHIPMIVNIQLPNPKPNSATISVYDKWFVDLNR